MTFNSALFAVEENICAKIDIYSQSKKNACEILVGTTVLSTAVNCSPLAISAGLSALQTVGPAKLAELSMQFPKLILGSVRLLQTANLVTLPITVWSVTSFGLAALEKDKKCFENIEFKTLEMNLLRLNSELIKNKIRNLSDFDQRQLEFPADYLKDDFIKNISCQRLQQLGLEQKRKFDPIIGKALADKKISEDPRRVLNVEVNSLQNTILSNLDCWPAEKKLNAICTAGNTMLLAKTAFAKSSGLQSEIASQLATKRLQIVEQRKKTLENDINKFFDPDAGLPMSEEKKQLLQKINRLESVAVKKFDTEIIENLNKSGLGIGKKALYFDRFGQPREAIVTSHKIDNDSIWLNTSEKVIENGKVVILNKRIPAADAVPAEINLSP